MITLQKLQNEYGYTLLTPDEIKGIREHSLNWNSLEGELVIRKCLKSYPAYLQATIYGYHMTAYHYSMAANLQREFERGPNAKPGLEKLVDRTKPYDPSKPDINRMPYGLILLSAPPQTGKSLTITESFQSWILTKYPRLGVLTLGYASDFAARFGRRNKDKFTEYAPIFTHGKVKIHDKVQGTEAWETMVLELSSNSYVSTNGGMSTAGLRGVVTGKTGNVVVIDDPIKNMQDAESPVMIEGNIEAFQSTVETRLLGNPGSLCIVMCTRWVSNDIIGWLRKHRKQFIVGDYRYASLTTEDNKSYDPLKREVGEGICPEMGKDSSWAQVIKDSYTASQGGHVYNALFQSEPTNMLGNLFKTDNWQEYEIDKVWIPERFDRIYLSIDATFKDNTENDFVAMIVGGFKQGNEYKRYVVRKRMDFPDTVDKILYLLKKFPEIDIIYIEDKANGPGIISVIRKWRRKLNISERDFPSIYPIEPEGGKYSRAQSSAIYQRDGRCFLPCEKDSDRFSCEEDFEWDDESGKVSYVQCFKHELGTFPYGVNDDLVDAHSQVINKNIPLLTGDEIIDKKPRRFVTYSKWWPEMEEDYNQLRTEQERTEFIRIHGANEKWKPKEEGGTYGVI